MEGFEYRVLMEVVGGGSCVLHQGWLKRHLLLLATLAAAAAWPAA